MIAVRFSLLLYETLFINHYSEIDECSFGNPSFFDLSNLYVEIPRYQIIRF